MWLAKVHVFVCYHHHDIILILGMLLVATLKSENYPAMLIFLSINSIV